MKKLLILLSLFFIPIFAAAEEKILNFSVALQVTADGVAIVKESITANVQHQQIRRGIYRDIPNDITHPVEFMSLEMDGQPHPYFTETKGKNLRINFGDDNYIPKGIHTYELNYKMGNAVIFNKNYDEIYWNVTGNYWDFPIARATLKLTLPKDAVPIRQGISIYTGYNSAKDRNAMENTPLSFETTRPLGPKQGFTVAVPWQKGIVQQDKSVSVKRVLLMGVSVILLILAFIYYIVTWYKVGRDPKDLFVTEFTPPQDISPAMMRYIYSRKIDIKSFAAGLVSLAIKGKIEIGQKKPFLNTSTILNAKDISTEGLNLEEDVIVRGLFVEPGSFDLKQKNGTKVSSTLKSIQTTIKEKCKTYVKKNTAYIFPPIIIMLLMQIPLLLRAPEMLFINLHYVIFTAVFVGLIAKKFLFKAILFILFTGFYTPFFLGFLVNALEPRIIIVSEICFIFAYLAFFIYNSLIDNVSAEGRPIYNHIRGFKRYMNMAEKYRVELSNPTDQEKIFCDYLPYAFALDMENKWINKFENILSATIIEKATKNLGGKTILTGGLILGLNSAMPTNKGSSGRSGGGSFGGGSSGGGRGGGGGGGR